MGKYYDCRFVFNSIAISVGGVEDICIPKSESNKHPCLTDAKNSLFNAEKGIFKSNKFSHGYTDTGLETRDLCTVLNLRSWMKKTGQGRTGLIKGKELIEKDGNNPTWCEVQNRLLEFYHFLQLVSLKQFDVRCWLFLVLFGLIMSDYPFKILNWRPVNEESQFCIR